MSARTVLVFGLAVCVVVPGARAASYSGTLSFGSGLDGTGLWVDPQGETAMLTYEVWDNPDGLWHYEYTFSGPAPSLGHFIVETSQSLTADEIVAIGGCQTWELQMQKAGGGANPNMPQDMYGLKFEFADDEEADRTFWLECYRAPIWLDFFGKSGKKGGEFNTVWNEGFGSDLPEFDPPFDPNAEPETSHILAPDTFGSSSTAPAAPAMPEPATVALCLMGIAAVGAKLRRRRQT